jgi:hypothetical protein
MDHRFESSLLARASVAAFHVSATSYNAYLVDLVLP